MKSKLKTIIVLILLCLPAVSLWAIAPGTMVPIINLLLLDGDTPLKPVTLNGKSGDRVSFLCSEYAPVVSSRKMKACDLDFPDLDIQPLEFSSQELFDADGVYTDTAFIFDLPFKSEDAVMDMNLTIHYNIGPAKEREIKVNIDSELSCLAGAGKDLQVVEGSTVILDPVNSFDYFHDCTYSWEQITSQTSIALEAGANHTASFTAPMVSSQLPITDLNLKFRLTVSDQLGNSSTDDMLVKVTREPPEAVLLQGFEEYMDAGTSRTLDASGSKPSSGFSEDDLEYHWELTDKRDWCFATFDVTPDSSLKMCDDSSTRQSNTSTSTFSPLGYGTFEIMLTVKNGPVAFYYPISILAGKDEIHPLIAIAGADQHVLVDEVVKLDGSHSANNGISSLKYSWEITAPEAEILSQKSPDPIASFVPDVEGVYEVTLAVEDDKADRPVEDKVRITVGDSYFVKPPNANAGAIQYIPETSPHPTITLNGENSDGGESLAGEQFSTDYKWIPLEYPFSFPVLSNDTGAKATFVPTHPGEYKFRLKISSDGDESSSTDGYESYDDTIVVYGKEAPSVCPIAVVESPQFVTEDSWQVFKGDQSFSPDGASLKYRWTVLSHPAMSKKRYAFDNPNVANVSFRSQDKGSYVLLLSVDNGNPNIGSCPRHETKLTAYFR